MALTVNYNEEGMPDCVPTYLFDQAERYKENPRDAALEWFNSAILGLSLHFGLPSLLGKGEEPQGVLAEELYRKLPEHFHCKNFDAVDAVELAIAATADAINTMNLKEKARKAEEARQKAEAEATVEKLKSCMVKLTAKAGSGGRLFGAVTTKEISEGLKAQFDIDIPKQKLVLDEPIKAFGSYQVKAKLGFEVVGTVYVSVFEEK